MATVHVGQDRIRIVLPSRAGEALAVFSTVAIGFGVFPVIAAAAIGWPWALSWTVVAAVLAARLVRFTRGLVRPRVDLTVGLRRLDVSLSWLGVSHDHLRFPWDALAAADLLPVGMNDPWDEVELVLTSADGRHAFTGVRGPPRMLAQLLPYLRERIVVARAEVAGTPDDRKALADVVRRGLRPSAG